MDTQQTQAQEYFNLHITGIGYLNRIREVKTKKGAYWACDITALHGDKADVQTTRFDCNVTGHEAITLVKKCQQADKDCKKILIGFKLGDLTPETFIYNKGTKSGETGISLKSRLLFISWIKIDGESVYTPPPKADELSQQ
jgi:hypothetical protein